MTEYTAVAIALVGLIFYLVYVALNLSDQYGMLKPFLLGVSFWLGAVLLNFVIQTVNPLNLHTFLHPAYYLWMVTITVVFSYIVVLLIIKGYNSIQKKGNKIQFDDDKE